MVWFRWSGFSQGRRQGAAGSAWAVESVLGLRSGLSPVAGFPFAVSGSAGIRPLPQPGSAETQPQFCPETREKAGFMLSFGYGRQAPPSHREGGYLSRTDLFEVIVPRMAQLLPPNKTCREASITHAYKKTQSTHMLAPSCPGFTTSNNPPNGTEGRVICSKGCVFYVVLHGLWGGGSCGPPDPEKIVINCGKIAVKLR